jgi:hypothetical protein
VRFRLPDVGAGLTGKTHRRGPSWQGAMARETVSGNNITMQETVFGMPLLLITCWSAYLIKLALSRRQRQHVSVREFLRLASGQ